MPIYLSQTEYAKHRGISQPRVSVMVKQGKLDGCIKKIGKYKKIDRDKADEALKNNLDRIYNPNRKVTKKEVEETIKAVGFEHMSMTEAQKAQSQYKAALLKLDYEERTGELISASQVKKEVFGMARMTRDAILNIPDHFRRARQHDKCACNLRKVDCRINTGFGGIKQMKIEHIIPDNKWIHYQQNILKLA